MPPIEHLSRPPQRPRPGHTDIIFLIRWLRNQPPGTAYQISRANAAITLENHQYFLRDRDSGQVLFQSATLSSVVQFLDLYEQSLENIAWKIETVYLPYSLLRDMFVDCQRYPQIETGGGIFGRQQLRSRGNIIHIQNLHWPQHLVRTAGHIETCDDRDIQDRIRAWQEGHYNYFCEWHKHTTLAQPSGGDLGSVRASHVPQSPIGQVTLIPLWIWRPGDRAGRLKFFYWHPRYHSFQQCAHVVITDLPPNVQLSISPEGTVFVPTELGQGATPVPATQESFGGKIRRLVSTLSNLKTAATPSVTPPTLPPRSTTPATPGPQPMTTLRPQVPTTTIPPLPAPPIRPPAPAPHSPTPVREIPPTFSKDLEEVVYRRQPARPSTSVSTELAPPSPSSPPPLPPLTLPQKYQQFCAAHPECTALINYGIFITIAQWVNQGPYLWWGLSSLILVNHISAKCWWQHWRQRRRLRRLCQPRPSAALLRETCTKVMTFLVSH